MGKPKTCNPCCDGGGGSSSSSRNFTGSVAPLPCGQCLDGVAPAQWTVTVAGFAAGTCSSGYCTQHNRTWTLSQTAACSWRQIVSTTPSSCGGFSNAAASFNIASVTGGTRFRLTLGNGAGTYATYDFIDSVPADCLTSIPLTRTSSSGECTSYPATLTISPA